MAESSNDVSRMISLAQPNPKWLSLVIDLSISDTSTSNQTVRTWCVLYMLTLSLSLSLSLSSNDLSRMIPLSLHLKLLNGWVKNMIWFLCMLTSKWIPHAQPNPKWRAVNFVFLIWAAGSAPAAVASLLVDPPEPQGIGKHYLLAPLHLLSSDSFSSLICSLLLLAQVISLPLPISAFHPNPILLESSNDIRNPPSPIMQNIFTKKVIH